MHHYSTKGTPPDDWERQARDELWDDEERRIFSPAYQHPYSPLGDQPLTLLLTKRMSAQLHAVAHDLELPIEEAALSLLRDTLWRHYHMMQHV